MTTVAMLNLRELAVKSGIEFYALSGPYDAADELIRQYKKNFEKKKKFIFFWLKRNFYFKSWISVIPCALQYR